MFENMQNKSLVHWLLPKKLHVILCAIVIINYLHSFKSRHCS